MAPKWRFSPNLIQIVPDHNRYKPCGNNRLQMLLDFSPDSSAEQYSHLFEEVELRLAESAQVGVGFDIPAYIAPNCSKGSVLSDVQVNM